MTLHVCKHSSQLCSVIFVKFLIIFFSTMTSLCRHLSAQEIMKTGSRLPTGVFTPPTRHNSTVSSRRRCVLGFMLPSFDKEINNYSDVTRKVILGQGILAWHKNNSLIMCMHTYIHKILTKTLQSLHSHYC